MKIFFYATRPLDKVFYEEALAAKGPSAGHELVYAEEGLSSRTAGLCQGFAAVCITVNDCCDRQVLTTFADQGTRLVLLRSTGFDHVDMVAAKELGICVMRVPAYSPYSVAEHAVALLMTTNRKIHKAYHRVKEQDFRMEGLVGYDVHGKTVGVVGTGKIGRIFARIMMGFGCSVLAYDIFPNKDFAQRHSDCFSYVALEELWARSDVISLHVPLLPTTKHLINAGSLEKMKAGVTIINTGRGGLIDTPALLPFLFNGKIRALGLDVYEGEKALFYKDHSADVIADPTWHSLISFPNVVITGHQASVTKEAWDAIASITLDNATAFEQGSESPNELTQVLQSKHIVAPPDIHIVPASPGPLVKQQQQQASSSPASSTEGSHHVIGLPKSFKYLKAEKWTVHPHPYNPPATDAQGASTTPQTQQESDAQPSKTPKYIHKL